MSTSSSPIEICEARAQRVALTEDALVVDLVDGRTISVPLTWYPRLAHGSQAERAHWRLIGEGEGVHWPALDEDLSVDGLIRAASGLQATTESHTAYVMKDEPKK